MHIRITGALVGLGVGLAALAAVFAATLLCLPYRISMPARPWPAICSDPVYGLVTYLAFPVNLISNDLSNAVLLAPLSLLVYVILGVLIASFVKPPRPDG